VRESLVNSAPLNLGGGDRLGVAITGVAVSASVAIAAAVGGRTAGDGVSIGKQRRVELAGY